MTQAGLPRRIGALVIDWLVASMTIVAVTGSTFSGETAADARWSLVAFFVEVTLLVGLTGTTLGKRLLGIRVVTSEQTVIGLGRAAIRTALLCLIIPALITTDQQRGLHDLAAGSMAVKA